MIFLETVDLTNFAAGGIAGGLVALALAFMVFIAIVIVALYLYSSFAYMAIARKAKYKHPGIAWIPGVGPLIVTNRIARMHWWPFLLFAGFMIPVIGFVAIIMLSVFQIVWLWKTFEKLKRPGWWAILCLIPIVNLVFLGIVAWSK